MDRVLLKAIRNMFRLRCRYLPQAFPVKQLIGSQESNTIEMNAVKGEGSIFSMITKHNKWQQFAAFGCRTQHYVLRLCARR
jgi:hypothetical protein